MILTEQALTSLLSFGAIFILSKLASISVFGDFVVTYSYASFVFIFISYFISSPVLVFYTKNWKSKPLTYLLSLLIISLSGTIIISLICSYLLNIQIGNVNFLAFLGLNLGMVINDLLKKTIFASRMVNFASTVISSISLVLLFFGLTLYFSNQLSLNFILTIYAISYFVSITILSLSIIKWGEILVFKHNIKTDVLNNINYILKEHYAYSKWIIGGGVLFWAYSQGIFIMGEIMGIDKLGLGKVRSIQNLLGLFTILIASMESYYIPKYSDAPNKLHQLVNEFYTKLRLPLIAVFLLTLPMVYIVYNFVYEEKYGSGFWIILVIWLSQIITVYLRPLAMALKAKEITFPLFYTHLIASISLIVLGTVVISFFGNLGLALAIFIAFLSSNLVLIYFYRKFIKSSEKTN